MNVAFGQFILDSDTRELRRRDARVHLSPKAFDLLVLLLERRPAVVSKQDIQERLWPSTFVEDANVSVLVADIRRALDDEPRAPAFVRTVHGRGYAFSGTATEVAPTQPPASRESRLRQGYGGQAPITCWLAWREHSRPLTAGVNVVGRDPTCQVWVDARGVSRRHAQITVAETGVMLEDLESTNGTFVGEAKVTSPRMLANGDVIGLGPETMTFHVWSEDRPATERVRRRSR
jgi:DNA-binding winged helix-turn-helix (wHTH) protein